MNTAAIDRFSYASFRCFNTLGYIPFVSSNSSIVRSFWGMAQIIAGISMIIFEFIDDFYHRALKRLDMLFVGNQEIYKVIFSKKAKNCFLECLGCYRENIQVEKTYAKELIFRGFYDLARARIEMIPILGNLTTVCYDAYSSVDLVSFGNKDEPKNYCMAIYRDFFENIEPKNA